MLILFQIIIAIILIAVILLQPPEGGLGAIFGQSSSYRTRQGMEKLLFTLTIILICLSLILSIVSLIK